VKIKNKFVTGEDLIKDLIKRKEIKSGIKSIKFKK